MIIDALSNINKYASVHPLFQKAIEFIQSQNLQNMEAGKYEIDGKDLNAIVFKKAAKSEKESLEKFECHDQHIDIQVCISGKEILGWKPREKCKVQKDPYDPDKDVLYYTDAPDMFFELTDGQFVIFFPEDVHAPMIGEGEIKKLVVKVKI